MKPIASSPVVSFQTTIQDGLRVPALCIEAEGRRARVPIAYFPALAAAYGISFLRVQQLLSEWHLVGGSGWAVRWPEFDLTIELEAFFALAAMLRWA